MSDAMLDAFMKHETYYRGRGSRNGFEDGWKAALAHQAERELQLVAFTKLAMLDFMDKTSADILAEFENQVKT